MKSRIKNLLTRKKALSADEKAEGARKRQYIIDGAEAMRRLMVNPDFIFFMEAIEKDKEGLVSTLLNENINVPGNDEFRIRLIARVNQIDRVLKKPKQFIWQLENLTEVRAAIKKQTLERQALGNKTGG